MVLQAPAITIAELRATARYRQSARYPLAKDIKALPRGMRCVVFDRLRWTCIDELGLTDGR
jgi:hypothetical protein